MGHSSSAGNVNHHHLTGNLVSTGRAAALVDRLHPQTSLIDREWERSVSVHATVVKSKPDFGLFLQKPGNRLTGFNVSVNVRSLLALTCVDGFHEEESDAH
jgi:hypothetical protein